MTDLLALPPRRWATLAILLMASTTACRRSTRVETHDAPPAPSLPTDRLAPGEVPEGTERAFALALPRTSRVVARYASSVAVRSPLSPELISNFIQARVKSGQRIVGASTTLFDHVVVPSEPGRQLSIEIRLFETLGERTSITISDVTAPPPAEVPNEEAWRRAGRNAEGKLIDPSKVE